MPKTVKLLLKESIRSVGRVGDIVDVSPGYARNYLLPQDLAVEPTPNNIKKVEERRKEIEKIERERREQQAALIARLSGVEVSIERRANATAPSGRPKWPRACRRRATTSSLTT